MNIPRPIHPDYSRTRQRGVVLFVALIALVTLMLAAMALTRSVDTNTVIAGNLTLRQSAHLSSDSGIESASAWLNAVATANLGNDPSLNPLHPFNITNAAEGYYSFVHTDESFLTADTTWANGASKYVGKDISGNEVRYIIERMCRNENTIPAQEHCLFIDADTDGDPNNNGDPQPSKGGNKPLRRVTVRVTGPKNTVTYSQAYLY